MSVTEKKQREIIIDELGLKEKSCLLISKGESASFFENNYVDSKGQHNYFTAMVKNIDIAKEIERNVYNNSKTGLNIIFVPYAELSGKRIENAINTGVISHIDYKSKLEQDGVEINSEGQFSLADKSPREIEELALKLGAVEKGDFYANEKDSRPFSTHFFNSGNKEIFGYILDMKDVGASTFYSNGGREWGEGNLKSLKNRSTIRTCDIDSVVAALLKENGYTLSEHYPVFDGIAFKEYKTGVPSTVEAKAFLSKGDELRRTLSVTFFSAGENRCFTTIPKNINKDDLVKLVEKFIADSEKMIMNTYSMKLLNVDDEFLKMSDEQRKSAMDEIGTKDADRTLELN